MCQLVIFLPYISLDFWTLDVLRGECNKPKTVDWMPNGAMKSDFWECAEGVSFFLKITCNFPFPWMWDGCSVTVSNLQRQKHISEFNWGVPYRKFKQLETLPLKCLRIKDGKRTKCFSDFQISKKLIPHLFSYKQKKVCIHSLLLLALKHCVTMEMGIFCPPRTVQHQNCLYRAADRRHSKIGRHKWRERICRIKQILSAFASEAPRFKSCLYEMELYIYKYIYIHIIYNWDSILRP